MTQSFACVSITTCMMKAGEVRWTSMISIMIDDLDEISGDEVSA
jgi:hypothetical protein